MNKKILKIFLIWLGLLMLVGIASLSLSHYGAKTCNTKNQLPYYRWDSFWYTSIARHGYTFSTEKNSSIAFFPLYPLAIKATNFIVRLRDDRVSFGLNIMFSLLMAVYLYRLALFDHSKTVSRNVVAAVLFFPPAYFLLSGYPEALFVLLGVLSLYFGRKNKWLMAGIVSALLAITKPYGIFMMPTLLCLYAEMHDWDWRIFFKKFSWTPLLFPISTFSGFVAFNYFKFGNPLAFLATQQTWGRSLGSPLTALAMEAKFYLLDSNIFTGSNFPYVIYLSSLVFSIFALTLSWKNVKKSYLVFPVLLLTSAFLTGTLTSWDRYMLLGFPILIGPAIYFSKNKYLFWAYLSFSAFAMLVMASFFVRCFPVE
ncbi:MAG: hypothetical protein PHW24_00745 [Candidatus Moranbacteria bacterium]|nr:hypothetical protein [Candidatus Moranbacteria bacterium]